MFHSVTLRNPPESFNFSTKLIKNVKNCWSFKIFFSGTINNSTNFFERSLTQNVASKIVYHMRMNTVSICTFENSSNGFISNFIIELNSNLEVTSVINTVVKPLGDAIPSHLRHFLIRWRIYESSAMTRARERHECRCMWFMDPWITFILITETVWTSFDIKYTDLNLNTNLDLISVISTNKTRILFPNLMITRFWIMTREKYYSFFLITFIFFVWFSGRLLLSLKQISKQLVLTLLI